MKYATIESLSWPSERLGEALELLGRHTGFSGPRPARAGSTGSAWGTASEGSLPSSWAGSAGGPSSPAQAGNWIEHTAARLGLEAEPVDAPLADAEQMLRKAAPAVVGLPAEAPRSFLVLLRTGRRSAVALLPDSRQRKVDPDWLLSVLRPPEVGLAASQLMRILEATGLHGTRRERARRAFERELASGRRVSGVWWIRPAGWSRLRSQAREATLWQPLVTLVAAQTMRFLLWIMSWWLLGRAALEGRLDGGWLAGWGLLLLTLIPLQLAASRSAGLLSIRGGVIMKRRLLFGALQLGTEEVRHLGSGQLLGRVIESDVIEQMALAGGFLAVTGLIEVLLSGVILASGAGGWLHIAFLASWLGVTASFCYAYSRRRSRWTRERLSMTNDLVESMVGHRTRLAQQDPELCRDGEDHALEHYLVGSRSVDVAGARLTALVPRGWLAAGVAGLVPAFAWGGGSTASLAVAIGGVLLAHQAFRHLADGLERCVAARIAWKEVRPFWLAASRVKPLGEFAIAAGGGSKDSPCETLLELRDVGFHYPGRTEPVLSGVNLRIRPGDRILLQGASGGGKSTLGSLLSGAREPLAGLMLLRGLDVETLGRDEWRRHAVLVPQFHENHVFLGSFAFNVLMGRGWPPGDEDMREAEQVCRSLGLGPLLDRMPAGMLQLVGETGWQLSHGERSRVYIARALLQGPQVMILDESFAALDPETLGSALAFILERARTVVVIAHP